MQTCEGESYDEMVATRPMMMEKMPAMMDYGQGKFRPIYIIRPAKSKMDDTSKAICLQEVPCGKIIPRPLGCPSDDGDNYLLSKKELQTAAKAEKKANAKRLKEEKKEKKRKEKAEGKGSKKKKRNSNVIPSTPPYGPSLYQQSAQGSCNKWSPTPQAPSQNSCQCELSKAQQQSRIQSGFNQYSQINESKRLSYAGQSYGHRASFNPNPIFSSKNKPDCSLNPVREKPDCSLNPVREKPDCSLEGKSQFYKEGTGSSRFQRKSNQLDRPRSSFNPTSIYSSKNKPDCCLNQVREKPDCSPLEGKSQFYKEGTGSSRFQRKSNQLDRPRSSFNPTSIYSSKNKPDCCLDSVREKPDCSPLEEKSQFYKEETGSRCQRKSTQCERPRSSCNPNPMFSSNIKPDCCLVPVREKPCEQKRECPPLEEKSQFYREGTGSNRCQRKSTQSDRPRPSCSPTPMFSSRNKPDCCLDTVRESPCDSNRDVEQKIQSSFRDASGKSKFGQKSVPDENSRNLITNTVLSLANETNLSQDNVYKSKRIVDNSSRRNSSNQRPRKKSCTQRTINASCESLPMDDDDPERIGTLTSLGAPLRRRDSPSMGEKRCYKCSKLIVPPSKCKKKEKSFSRNSNRCNKKGQASKKLLYKCDIMCKRACTNLKDEGPMFLKECELFCTPAGCDQDDDNIYQSSTVVVGRTATGLDCPSDSEDFIDCCEPIEEEEPKKCPCARTLCRTLCEDPERILEAVGYTKADYCDASCGSLTCLQNPDVGVQTDPEKKKKICGCF